MSRCLKKNDLILYEDYYWGCFQGSESRALGCSSSIDTQANAAVFQEKIPLMSANRQAVQGGPGEVLIHTLESKTSQLLLP